MNRYQLSRRYFFYGPLLAGAIPAGGFGSVPSLSAAGFKSYLNKLNIAGVGIGGRGASDLAPVAVSENIVALCDVNDTYAAHTFNTYPKAEKFKDFRQMLDKRGREIDAVIIGTPDHSHTPVALAAMQHGKHVYCEKPLARTVWEARLLRQAAAKYKVATQMGNQGYSHEGTRTCAEILWSGEIGSVREVHSWTGLIFSGRVDLKGAAPPEEPIPDGLDWDLWLTTAATRPYYSEMFRRWRNFIDFSTGGSLGDWVVHNLGPANLALQLDKAPPISVECVKIEEKDQRIWPLSARLRYEFPARGAMPPVNINVYLNMPPDVKRPDGMAEDEPLLPPTNNLAERGRPAPPQPGAGAFGGRGGTPGQGGRGDAGQGGRAGAPGGPGAPGGQRGPSAAAGRGTNSLDAQNGALFVGDKGYMATIARGEGVWLLPASRWKDYQLPPQLLPRSVSHQQDWVRACKGGTPACSNFDIAVPYIEWLILGAVALRAPGKLMWDAANMRFTNNNEANQYLKPYIRKGWELKL